MARFAPLIPSGEVLDLACGNGRHSRLLTALGHTVLAVDRDPQALRSAAGPGINTLQADLESGIDGANWPFEKERFAGIVVTNYLHRTLFPHLFAGLTVGGVLIYETFADGNAQFGRPSSPRFLLNRAELLDAVRGQSRPDLHVLAYEDGYLDTPRPAMVQRICVVRTAGDAGDVDPHRWRLS